MAQDSTGRRTAHPTPRLGAVIARAWHGLVKDLFDSYHPERHYMRGPGPKWREKQGYAVASGHTLH